MAFQAKPLNAQDINNNTPYQEGDGLQPSVVNDIIGGILNLQESGGGNNNQPTTDVEANPSEEATEDLSKLKIGETVYSIPKEIIVGTNAPTNATVGELGQFYTNTTTGTSYQCKAIENGVYTWVELVDKTMLDTKLDKKTKNVNFVYGYFAGSGGIQTTYNLGTNYASVNNGTIAQHFGEAQASIGERAPKAGTGFIYCAIPISPYFAAPKKYVDDNKGSKLYKHKVDICFYDPADDYQTLMGYLSFYFYSTKSTPIVEVDESFCGFRINEANFESVVGFTKVIDTTKDIEAQDIIVTYNSIYDRAYYYDTYFPIDSNNILNEVVTEV